MKPSPVGSTFIVNGCTCHVRVMQGDDGDWVGWVHVEPPTAGARTVPIPGTFSTLGEAMEAANDLANALADMESA